MYYIPNIGMHGVNSWFIPILVCITYFRFNSVGVDPQNYPTAHRSMFLKPTIRTMIMSSHI